jgi:hypothetical protein
MTMTEPYRPTDNYGAAEPAGEPGSAAPRRQRRNRPLSDQRLRVLVARHLEEKIAEQLTDPSLADQFIADQLDDVANELRGTD